MLNKDEGIILRNIPFKNTSIVSHIYTRNSGNISFIIKGYKKSKLLGNIESGYHISLVYYKKENQEMGIIKEVNILSPYYNIRYDNNKIKILFSILYLLEHSPKSLKLWEITLRVLDYLENKNNYSVFGYFLMHFLHIEGIFPVLKKCSVCGSKEIKYFSIVKNGTVCDEHKTEEDTEIDGWFNTFLNIYNGKLTELPENSYNFILDLLIRYGEYHLGDWVSHLRNILSPDISQ